jgi:hypothetical protein
MNRDEEQIGRILQDLSKRGRKKTGRSGCPDDESLASYLSRLLPEHAEKGMERHLADCSLCLDDLVAVHKAAQDEEEGVPQGIVERAMALVHPALRAEHFLDLAVRLVRDSVELVRTSGHLIPTWAPVGIRGRPGPSATGILQVEKEIGNFKVSVEVERVDAGFCQVAVKVKRDDASVSNGFRVSLISRGREQASYLTRQGEAMFDRVPLGEYNLSISDSGTPVGSIRLELTE